MKGTLVHKNNNNNKEYCKTAEYGLYFFGPSKCVCEVFLKGFDGKGWKVMNSHDVHTTLDES